MATTRITITIDEDIIEQVRSAVGPGEVSAYVTEAVRARLQRDPVMSMLDTLSQLDPAAALTPDELEEGDRWLDDVLGRLEQTSASSSTPER